MTLSLLSGAYFGGFIGEIGEPIIFTVIFILLTCIVVYRGVNKGIEALSKILMPFLFVLIIGISIYTLTINGGEKYDNRTGIDGFLCYVIPNVDGMSVGDVLKIIMSAMPQVFAQMGAAGTVLGIIFFLMVLFAALTSSVSLLEAVVSGMVDKGMGRKNTRFITRSVFLRLL